MAALTGEREEVYNSAQESVLQFKVGLLLLLEPRTTMAAAFIKR